jgi:hypothetical protein
MGYPMISTILGTASPISRRRFRQPGCKSLQSALGNESRSRQVVGTGTFLADCTAECLEIELLLIHEFYVIL